MAATPPRRRADAERNIEGILAAARDLFSRGLNPSMIEIAQAAGIGRVTLYSHFPSREVLLEAVIERAMTETDEALTGLRLEEASPPDALARLVRTSWSVLDRHRRLHSVAVTVLGPEGLRRQHDRAFQHVDRLIARGQADGAFRGDLPRRWLVTTCYALIHAAADEVEEGQLAAADVPEVLTATLLSSLTRT
ncbi:TetR/AcrR family transcriptional regulator [Amycolatopsis thermophila]|uniref:AcrR family transcriptional regulator n=1 Tax=Amycolatopsis thermophila TaxID=206084 RepID=A0ABU0F333_9PSEU|nr:TetR/AcrR family transcriptional regulator [Amycolatopsis thermophila]MDQ0381991.1 AcrR family transcriptional regulator [Amycolatopsis thermophila]